MLRLEKSTCRRNENRIFTRNVQDSVPIGKNALRAVRSFARPTYTVFFAKHNAVNGSRLRSTAARFVRLRAWRDDVRKALWKTAASASRPESVYGWVYVVYYRGPSSYGTHTRVPNNDLLHQRGIVLKRRPDEGRDAARRPSRTRPAVQISSRAQPSWLSRVLLFWPEGVGRLASRRNVRDVGGRGEKNKIVYLVPPPRPAADENRVSYSF